MYSVPVVPSITKLTWDKETRKVDEYNDLPNGPQNKPDHVDHGPIASADASTPPNSASTVVATESYATVKIKTEDVSHRAHAPSKPLDPVGDIDESSDSDLTEIDDDVPGVASNPADATLGIPREGGVIDDDNFVVDNAGSTRRSSRRRCPTRRQTLLWEEGVDSDEKDHTRRRHSLPAPGKPSNISTTPSHPVLPLRAPKRKEVKAGRNAHRMRHAVGDDLMERRTSSRLQTAVAKSISFAEYSDEDDDDDHSSKIGRSSGSAGSSRVATDNVVPKAEIEGNDVREPDSWKAGWSKSDSWAKESTKIEPVANDDPVATRKLLPVRSSHRSQRRAALKKSHSKLIMGRRIECPKGCGKTFGRAHDAHRHADQTVGCGGGHKAFICHSCGNYFSRKDALKRHQGYANDGKRSVLRRCSTLHQSD